MQQEHKRRQTPKQDTVSAETEEPAAQTTTEDDHRKAETDALLDEIDGLLEENAEDFVRGYLQKGGE